MKSKCYIINYAGIAQLVEQWIENPRVTSSTLVPGILRVNNITEASGFRVKYKLNVPIGPFLCFAIVISANFDLCHHCHNIVRYNIKTKSASCSIEL